MFIRTAMLSQEDKIKVSEMMSKILLWIMEGRHMGYMIEHLDLPPQAIEHNIDEALYTYMKHVGKWRYFKILFMK